jgi:hypothetical protein
LACDISSCRLNPPIDLFSYLLHRRVRRGREEKFVIFDTDKTPNALSFRGQREICSSYNRRKKQIPRRLKPARNDK